MVRDSSIQVRGLAPIVGIRMSSRCNRLPLYAVATPESRLESRIPRMVAERVRRVQFAQRVQHAPRVFREASEGECVAPARSEAA